MPEYRNIKNWKVYTFTTSQKILIERFWRKLGRK